jgi:hypothetical protein
MSDSKGFQPDEYTKLYYLPDAIPAFKNTLKFINL